MSKGKDFVVSVGDVDMGGFRIGLLAMVPPDEAKAPDFFMMDPSGSAMIPMPSANVSRYLEDGKMHFEEHGSEARLRALLARCPKPKGKGGRRRDLA